VIRAAPSKSATSSGFASARGTPYTPPETWNTETQCVRGEQKQNCFVCGRLYPGCVHFMGAATPPVAMRLSSTHRRRCVAPVALQGGEPAGGDEGCASASDVLASGLEASTAAVCRDADTPPSGAHTVSARRHVITGPVGIHTGVVASGIGANASTALAATSPARLRVSNCSTAAMSLEPRRRAVEAMHDYELGRRRATRR
jgi:hypothetical protein